MAQEVEMSKRFTDNGMWDRPWFRKLRPTEKCAIRYILDKCDNVGVWIPDFETAEFFIGGKVDWDMLIKGCHGNLEILDNGKWWVIDYIRFQHGDLFSGSQSNACLSYLKLLQEHGLDDYFPELIQAYPKPWASLGLAPKERVRVKVREKEKEKEEAFKNEVDEVFEYFRTKTGSHVQSTTEALRAMVRARLQEGYSVEDCKRAIAFSYGSKKDNPDQRQYIRIKTIFAPTNFSGYLDAQLSYTNKGE